MAESRSEGDAYLLIENHCPICAAATECQGFCRAERDVFQHALGSDVSVERTEHIVAGDRRCAYRIELKTIPQTPSAGKGGTKHDASQPVGKVGRPARRRHRRDVRPGAGTGA